MNPGNLYKTGSGIFCENFAHSKLLIKSGKMVRIPAFNNMRNFHKITIKIIIIIGLQVYGM